MACVGEAIAAGSAAVICIGGAMAVDAAIDAAAAAGTAASGGTAAPAAIPAAVLSNLVILIGSYGAYIGCLVMLVNCYNAAGDHENAAKVQAKIDAMQNEVHQMQALADRLRAAVGV
jgi:hypothetical protein